MTSFNPELTSLGPTGLPQHRELLQAVEQAKEKQETAVKSQLRLKITVPKDVNWTDQATVTGLKVIDLNTVLSKLQSSKEAVEDYFAVEDEKGVKVFSKNDALALASQIFKGRVFNSDKEKKAGIEDLCQAITDTTRANTTHEQVGNEVVQAMEEMTAADSVRQKLDKSFPVWKPTTDPKHSALLSKLTQEFNTNEVAEKYAEGFDPSGKIRNSEGGQDFLKQAKAAAISVDQKKFVARREKEAQELEKGLNPEIVKRIRLVADLKNLQKDLKSLTFGERRIEALKEYYLKINTFKGLLEDNRPYKMAEHMGVIFNPKEEATYIHFIKTHIVEELMAIRKQKIANIDFELVSFLENIGNEKLQKESSSKEVLDKVGYAQDTILRFVNMKLIRDKEVEKFSNMPIVGTPEGREELERMGKSFDAKIAQMLRNTFLDPKLVDLKNQIIRDKALPTKVGLIFSRKEIDVVLEIRSILSDLLLRGIYLNDQKAFLEANSIINEMRASTKGDAKFWDIVTREDLSTITSAQATVAHLQRLANTVMDKNIRDLAESHAKTPLSADATAIKEGMLKSGILPPDKKDEIKTVLMNSLANALYIAPGNRPSPDDFFEKSVEAEKLLELLHTPQGFPIFAAIASDPQLSTMLTAYEARKSAEAKKIAQRNLDDKLTPQQEAVKKDTLSKNIFFGIPKADFTKVLTHLIAESLLFSKKDTEKEVDRILMHLNKIENSATLKSLNESADYKILRQVYDERKKQGVAK